MIHERHPPVASTVDPQLRIDGISRSFGETQAVDDVSLDIMPGEFVTLLGDSGCGKTTLLRIIAGYTAPERGRILFKGQDITAMPPAQRRMGFVFQSYALFPHLDVAANIAFALRITGKTDSLRRARVAELAEMLEISHLTGRFPHELSGGQQQRVAIARALAASPQMLLLDEPMSALDARIRARLREELKALITDLGLTTLYVTHDQEEALAMSDRICVIHAGRLEQVGTPAQIYHRPASRFVAEFVGLSNIIDGTLASGALISQGEAWPVPVAEAHGAASAIYRPETINLTDPDTAPLRGYIQRVALLGALQRLWVQTPAGRIVLVERPSVETRWQAGMEVGLTPDCARACLLKRDRI